jgi:hypothetical protein
VCGEREVDARPVAQVLALAVEVGRLEQRAACVCSITVVTPARAAAAVPVGKSSRSGAAGSMK